MSKGRSKHMIDYYTSECPEPKEGEKIVKVVQPMGSNQVQVEREDGTHTLCLLPAKFRKQFWLKRGSFAIIEEAETANKERVTGTISHVLLPEHEKTLKRNPDIWPKAFMTKGPNKGEAKTGGAGCIDTQNRDANGENDDDDEASGALVANCNRRVVQNHYDTDSDDEESPEEVAEAQ